MATSSSDYDRHPYPTTAQAQLHPDNLFSSAWLKGFHPVPVTRARVLELGCANGRNLLPMALDLPDAEFVGMDYSAAQIAAASDSARNLGVPNVSFLHADITALREDPGRFDYIIAHGFYSWIPDAAREAFWELAERNLTEDGLLCVSFNVLPGWYSVQSLRDFGNFHAEPAGDSEGRFERAWGAIRQVADHGASEHPLAGEAMRSVRKGYEIALYDELYPDTRAFYFRDVVRRAAQSGLRYVGDAKERKRSGLEKAEALAALAEQGSCGDSIRREQYEDFFTMRRFRQSLFSRSSHQPAAVPPFERMRDLWITSLHTAGPPDAGGNRTVAAEGSAERFETADPLLLRLLDDLAAEAPGNLPFDEWWRNTATAIAPDPAARREFESALNEGVRTGLFASYPRSIRVPRTVPERPCVRALSRLEAAQGLGLTNLFHQVYPTPDPLLAGMVTLLNGERSIEEIAATLAEAIVRQRAQQAAFASLNGVAVPLMQSGAFEGRRALLEAENALLGFLMRLLPVGLEQLRRGALLVS